MLSHLDDLASRALQHVGLTLVALLFGFAISFGLAVVAVRHRTTYGPIIGISDLLYVIPSLAFFAALIPITGISFLTVEIPLVLYTLLILVRNLADGFDAVPSEVLEAADGMGYSRRERLRRIEIPLAVPFAMAGLRLACISTIGLVTVSAVLGDRFGGFGFFILEGYSRSFPTEIYFGALPSILLALAADTLLIRIQRRLTPWSRRASAGGPEEPRWT
ncbi:MAG: osmoprotectant transport system permease protein [Chloroflexota bacterium]|nr:osmoprotectant transport system permease protein [Chloroflexota bacterium]